jgi:hypothetical protein
LATGIPARLSAAEGRKFGLTVGGAFLVITGILWWRGLDGAVPYTGVLGAVLAAAGLLIPTRLGPVNRAWMGLAHLISRVTTPIFMGVVYFVVLCPIGVGMRLFGRNPMVHATGDKGFWFKRGTAELEASRMERQF